MPRALRIEYPGAIYHVLNRGDRCEPIFRDDFDHNRFLTTLAEVCNKTGWRMARRLRVETAVTLKWIAMELHMGAWTHVSNLLAIETESKNQIELTLCQ